MLAANRANYRLGCVFKANAKGIFGFTGTHCHSLSLLSERTHKFLLDANVSRNLIVYVFGEPFNGHLFA
jgi:hypothetical protein